MAIRVQIQNASISQEGLALAIMTTNDAIPGDEYTFGQTFAITKSAAAIKEEIDAAVTLLWVAVAVKEWTVP